MRRRRCRRCLELVRGGEERRDGGSCSRSVQGRLRSTRMGGSGSGREEADVQGEELCQGVSLSSWEIDAHVPGTFRSGAMLPPVAGTVILQRLVAPPPSDTWTPEAQRHTPPCEY
jgi:hypothetical protein